MRVCVCDFLPPYRSPTGYMIRRTLNWTLLFLTKGKEGNSPTNPFKPAAAHTHAVHLYVIQLLNLHDWCSVQSEHLIKRHLQSGLHVPVTYQYFTTPANAISAAIYNRGLQTTETQSIHTLFIVIKVWKHVELLVVALKLKNCESGSKHLFKCECLQGLGSCEVFHWLGVVCTAENKIALCWKFLSLTCVCIYVKQGVCVCNVHEQPCFTLRWFSVLNHSEEKFYFFHIQDWYSKDDIKTNFQI